MIDEPLALLAEAFGQQREIPIPSVPDSETSDDADTVFVIAAASVGQAERAAFAARTV